ncbi:MAG: CPBP family intramembrane metalloprotease [Acidobacteriota bacterium]
MKNTLLALAGLTLAAALAEAIILVRIHLDPLRLAALMGSLALLLGALVALTQEDFIERLRQWAYDSWFLAVLMPFTLLIPYLILAYGTDTFSRLALVKLAAYIAVPTFLLFPNRTYCAERASWRDFAALASLAVPVGAGWLRGIWIWPADLYIFPPIYCVCVAAYAFLVVRSLKDAGYKLIFTTGDLTEGTINFIAFILLAIPIGLALHFIHPQVRPVSVFAVIAKFVGVYLAVAIPEEFLFRGILQNLLVKTFDYPHNGLKGLLAASVIFGLSYLRFPPVPNWKFAIMATVAGIFYGNAWRIQKRTSSSAFTHALVDTVWRFWF